MSSRHLPLIPKLSLLSVGILGLLSACAGPDLPPLNPPTNNSIDLSAALGVTELAVIGVTVDATTGQRYVLDANAGIFEILHDGTANLVRSNQAFPIPDVAPVSAWTDFVALGDDQFAVTARNDGYLLDLDDDLMTEYFCYVPDMMEQEFEQLTHGLTLDHHAGLLYAQPATYDMSGMSGPIDEPIAASIGAYSLDGGQPVAWFDIPDIEFLAGGMAVDLDGSLLLGRGNELHRFVLEGEGRLEGIGVLEGVGRIDGMAVDSEAEELLLVDGEQGKLITLSLEF